MKKKLLSVLFYILIVISSGAYFWYEIHQRDDLINSLLSDLKRKVHKIIDLETCSQNRNHEIDYNGKCYSNNSKVISVTGEECALADLIRGNKLILRYSELNCNTCIEEQINMLNSYVDSIGIDNIFLFTTYSNMQYLKNFKRVNQIKFPIYNLTQKVNQEFEDLGLPYFFVLTEHGNRINSMYIPLKETPTLTQQYIHLILKKYFNETKDE